MSHLPTMLQHSMSDNWFSSTNCLSEMDSIDGSHITERKRNNDDVNKHQNDVSRSHFNFEATLNIHKKN